MSRRCHGMFERERRRDKHVDVCGYQNRDYFYAMAEKRVASRATTS